MLPIPGTSSVAHLEENVAASSLQLAENEWAEIEADAKRTTGGDKADKEQDS
jgi:aryl-alcohol dehydrogenase-like predicted oxidoreductase